MAYFGSIFFANMGGGGGQNYFHCVPRQVLNGVGADGVGVKSQFFE